MAFGPHATSIDRQAVISAIYEGADMVHLSGGASPAQLAANLNDAMFASADADDTEIEEPLEISTIVTDIFAGRTITQVSQVIERLDMRGDAGRLEVRQRWMDHLRRYLRGGQGTDRAVAFVRAMTGSRFLSVDPPLNRLTVR